MLTPFYFFLSYLTVKYCKMTMYLYKTFNGLDKLSIGIKVLIISITVVVITNHFFTVVLYLFPYIEFTLLRELLDRQINDIV